MQWRYLRPLHPYFDIVKDTIKKSAIVLPFLLLRKNMFGVFGWWSIARRIHKAVVSRREIDKAVG